MARTSSTVHSSQVRLAHRRLLHHLLRRPAGDEPALLHHHHALAHAHHRRHHVLGHEDADAALVPDAADESHHLAPLGGVYSHDPPSPHHPPFPPHPPAA